MLSRSQFICIWSATDWWATLEGRRRKKLILAGLEPGTSGSVIPCSTTWPLTGSSFFYRRRQRWNTYTNHTEIGTTTHSSHCKIIPVRLATDTIFGVAKRFALAAKTLQENVIGLRHWVWSLMQIFLSFLILAMTQIEQLRLFLCSERIFIVSVQVPSNFRMAG